MTNTGGVQRTEQVAIVTRGQQSADNARSRNVFVMRATMYGHATLLNGRTPWPKAVQMELLFQRMVTFFCS